MTSTENIKEEQITTKEFFLKLINFFKVIGSKWRILMLGLLLGAIASIIQDLINKKETKYEAKIIFNIDIGGGGAASTSQLGGLAASIGLAGNIPQGAQGGDLLSGTNFAALLQSRIVYERALMKNVQVNGKTLLMANYFKDSSDIADQMWKGDLFHEANEEAISYRFKQKAPKDLSPLENVIIGAIYEHLAPDTQLVPIEGSSLTQLTTKTVNEQLSKVWAETLLKAIEEFYVEMKTKKTREMLGMQQRRLDSLQVLMFSSDKRLAQLTFQNTTVVDPSGPMRQQQVTRNNAFYSNQYYTQLTTVEGLNRLLVEQTPILTIIEPIRFPLYTYVGGIGQSIKMGSLLGFFVALIYVLARHTYLQIMNSDTSIDETRG